MAVPLWATRLAAVLLWMSPNPCSRINIQCGMTLHLIHTFRFVCYPCIVTDWSFNQSINQSIAAISPTKPGSVAQQPNQCSVAKPMKHFHGINRLSVVRVSRGKGQVKDMCLQMFLEGSNWNGWTDRLRQVVPEIWRKRVKSSCTCVGLDPRDWQTNSFAWFQWWGKHWVKIIIIIHHYVPSVVNRSAIMDLHRSRSCATLMQSLYDIFVHSLMLSIHIVLGLPRPLLPFILPSISNRCTPSPLIICPKYCHFLFLWR